MAKARERSFLLKGISIALTQDSQRSVIRGADILVEDGKISKIGKGLRFSGEKIPCRNRLALPGLVNAHTHIPLSLLRGVGDDLPLSDWLEQRIFPLESRMGRRDYLAGASIGCLEAISTGTTTAFDFYNRTDLYRSVLEKSGMRVFCGQNIYDGKDGAGPKLAIAERMLRRNRPGGRVQEAVCPHSMYACSDETLVRCGELAGKYGARLQTHAGETRKEVADCENSRGCRPAELLARLNFLSPRASLAHCGWISKGEARLIGAAGASAVNCPVSNMKLATGGTMPLPELLASGANVALGTDSATSNNSLDMFETMKFSALLQKQHRWDARAVSAQQALDFATLGGAKAVGMGAETGSLEVGKQADLILLDLSSVRMRPMTDPVSYCAYSATGDIVTDVFVAGRRIKESGKVATIDGESSFAAAEKSVSSLIRRAGISV